MSFHHPPRGAVRFLICIVGMMLVVIGHGIAQTSATRIPIVVSDGAGGRQELVFGLDSAATAGIDPALGETELPPLPPAGVFDARFIGDLVGALLGEGVVYDIRPGSAPVICIHELRFQVGDGSAITLTWDLPGGVTGRLQDVLTGAIIDRPMAGTDSFVVSDPGVHRRLLMSMTYAGIPTAGHLSVTITSGEGVDCSTDSITVELRDSTGGVVATQTAGSDGGCSFREIPAGGGYSYRVSRVIRQNGGIQGVEFLGERTGISILPGEEISNVFERSMPYLISVRLFDEASGKDVSNGLVTPGTELRCVLLVKNPANTFARSYSVAGRVILDRQKASPFDLDQTTAPASIAPAETTQLVTSAVMNTEGAFYHFGDVRAFSDGNWLLTSVSAWGEQPIIVVMSDRTPPAAPQNITVQPGSWATSPSFVVDWKNPDDLSGIAAAWYKTGVIPPLRNDDGIRVVSKPCTVVVTLEGRIPLHMWLEDRAGNKDHTQRAGSELLYDATPPGGGRLVINSGSPTTNALNVQLAVILPEDSAGSGLASMSFSNDSSTWTPPELPDTLKEPWDLSGYGGTPGEGLKTVWVRFADSAGNTACASASTLFRTTSTEIPTTRIPESFALGRCYPNPFNASARIEYAVPREAWVEILLANVLGQTVQRVFRGRVIAGYHEVFLDASGLSSGMYVVRMVSEGFVDHTKVILAR